MHKGQDQANIVEVFFLYIDKTTVPDNHIGIQIKKCLPYLNYFLPGPVASLTADPGVMSSVLAGSHTFVKTDLRHFPLR